MFTVILGMFASIYFALQEIQLNRALTEEPAHIVAAMSLEEKVGQLIHMGLSGKKADKRILNAIRKLHVGGVIYFDYNLDSPDQITELSTDLQKASLDSSGIPLFISIDQEGGRVYRIRKGVTLFPGAMALGQAGNEKMAEEVGFITGYELRNFGINLNLAPVLDVNNNPSNPVINTRSFGSDADRVGRIGIAFARGLSQSYSTHCIKHFPGHGDTDTDSHLSLPSINKSIEELEETELRPFRRAVKEGAEMVMSAHIMFPKLDDKLPATLSPHIIREILRKRLHFNGPVTTDAMEMNAISKNYSYGESARMAFRAGVDIILLTSDQDYVDEVYQSLLDGFRNGDLSEKDLDMAVERQIALKFKKGLFTIHNSRYGNDERFQKYFTRELAKVDETYRQIQEEYTLKNSSLNHEVSLASIVSLYKNFDGLNAMETDEAGSDSADTNENSGNGSKKVTLFYHSDTMADHARELGIPSLNLVKMKSISELENLMKKRSPDEAWVVEVFDRDQKQWNELVHYIDMNYKNTIQASLVGLNAGNPFRGFRVPKNGAVLVSFSPTPESRNALIERALGGPVKKADLVLPEEN